MANQEEQIHFDAILRSKDWMKEHGAIPTRLQFEEFKRVVSAEELSFEDYFRFQSRSVAIPDLNEQSNFADEYALFKRSISAPVWQRFLHIFKRSPTFRDYTDFLAIRNETNWSQYECQRPQFETYLEYVLERDSVAFDWMQICGHVPTLLEYIVYLGIVAQVDWASLGVERPTFRRVVEEGAAAAFSPSALNVPGDNAEVPDTPENIDAQPKNNSSYESSDERDCRVANSDYESDAQVSNSSKVATNVFSNSTAHSLQNHIAGVSLETAGFHEDPSHRDLVSRPTDKAASANTKGVCSEDGVSLNDVNISQESNSISECVSINVNVSNESFSDFHSENKTDVSFDVEKAEVCSEHETETLIKLPPFDVSSNQTMDTPVLPGQSDTSETKKIDSPFVKDGTSNIGDDPVPLHDVSIQSPASNESDSEAMTSMSNLDWSMEMNSKSDSVSCNENIVGSISNPNSMDAIPRADRINFELMTKEDANSIADPDDCSRNVDYNENPVERTHSNLDETLVQNNEDPDPNMKLNKSSQESAYFTQEGKEEINETTFKDQPYPFQKETPRDDVHRASDEEGEINSDDDDENDSETGSCDQHEPITAPSGDPAAANNESAPEPPKVSDETKEQSTKVVEQEKQEQEEEEDLEEGEIASDSDAPSDDGNDSPIPDDKNTATESKPQEVIQVLPTRRRPSWRSSVGEDENQDEDAPIWCAICSVSYTRAQEKEHRLRFHEPKSVVYRCSECGWDHPSFPLMRAHYFSRHPEVPRDKVPITRHSRVQVAPIVVLPSCKTCGYGSLIPFANSYHSCTSLPTMVLNGELVAEGGHLIIEKARRCTHSGGGGGRLCARCESFFAPALPQINYDGARFIIDFGEGLDSHHQEIQAEIKQMPYSDDSDGELTIDDKPNPAFKNNSIPTTDNAMINTGSSGRLMENSIVKMENSVAQMENSVVPMESSIGAFEDISVSNVETNDLLTEVFSCAPGTIKAESGMEHISDDKVKLEQCDRMPSAHGTENQASLGGTSEINSSHNYRPPPTEAVAPKPKANERIFQCKECDYAFAVRGNLTAHRYAMHLIKDRVLRCRECGHDMLKYTKAKHHYHGRHPEATLPTRAAMEVYAKPFLHIPRCEDCGYQSTIPHALKYHQCKALPVLRGNELRIHCPDLCPHTPEAGDLCADCLKTCTPTERRVKYDCAHEQFVVSVRERFVAASSSDDDEDTSFNDPASGHVGGDKDDGGALSSDGERVDTSDESDENEETRDLREKFFLQQSTNKNGRQLHECRFCGKKKTKRTLVNHIRKVHCTKFTVFRCHLCGWDCVAYIDLRHHWRRVHHLDQHPSREEAEYVTSPYQQIKPCRKCHYASLIPHALDLHSCDALPKFTASVLYIEKDLKCEHSQDIKYSYGLGATSRVCADCVHLFVPDSSCVRYKGGVFAITVSQKLASDDPQYQAQLHSSQAHARGSTSTVGENNLTVSSKRLQDHSCTDLLTGIEIQERYFCAQHQQEYESAKEQIEHNHAWHARHPLTETFRCFVCAFDGHNFGKIKKHVLEYHKDDCVDNTLFIVKVSVPGNPRIPMCKHCGYACLDPEMFQGHECHFWVKESLKQGTEYPCPSCSASYCSQAFLRQHISNVHTTWVDIYRCFVCGFDSESFGTISKHIMKSHKEIKGQVVKTKCLLSVKKYKKIPKCPGCGFASLLDILMKKHKCTECPRKIFQSNLIPKSDRPGDPRNIRKNKKRPGEHQSAHNKPGNAIEGLEDYPPFPASWKSLRLISSKQLSAIAQKAEAKSQQRERAAKRRASEHNRHAARPEKRRYSQAEMDKHQKRKRTNSEHSNQSADHYSSEARRISSDKRTSIDDRSQSPMDQASQDMHYAARNDMNSEQSNMYSNTHEQQQYSTTDDAVAQAWAMGTLALGGDADLSTYYSSYTTQPQTQQPSTESGYSAAYSATYTHQSSDTSQSQPSTSTNHTMPNVYPPAYMQAPPMPTMLSASASISKAPPEVESETRCPHCCAIFPSPEAKRDHVYDQHEMKTTVFRCPACRLDTTTFAKLKRHCKAKHKKLNITQGTVERQVPGFMFVPLCPRGCGYASLSEEGMANHRCQMMR